MGEFSRLYCLGESTFREKVDESEAIDFGVLFEVEGFEERFSV